MGELKAYTMEAVITTTVEIMAESEKEANEITGKYLRECASGVNINKIYPKVKSFRPATEKEIEEWLH